MSAEHDPAADQPTSGTNRFPDPFAPDPSDPGGRGAEPYPRSASPGPASTSRSHATPTGAGAAPTAPGDQDLPWKATAQRRDLWGPVQKPLEGKVRSPGPKSVGRPRRSPLLRVGAPLLLGGLAAVATVVVGLGAALAGPLLVLGAAAGIGAVTLGGSALVLNAPRRGQDAPLLGDSVPESTRAMLERILEADATTGDRITRLRPQAFVPSATQVLDDVQSLLTRIDALVGSEQLQSLRPSSGEVTMLEGMATRYVPELVDAASDTLGFLQTFEGSAREEALGNLESIDAQLNVLAEGVEQIESDIVGGVSRSLEVHSEFLRTRFADQHLNPIIDV